MSFENFLNMLITEIVPIGIIITIVPSFVAFCAMKAWRIFEDIVLK